MSIFANRGTAAVPDSAQNYSNNWGVDSGYVVTLTVLSGPLVSDGGVFSVSTTMDESFGLSMGAQWDAPFANAMEEGLDKAKAGMGGKAQAVVGLAQLGAKASGVSTKNRYQTAQLWQSSDPMRFSIPFTFIAREDPVKEVQERVQKLLKLAAPSNQLGVMLTAPGPTLAGQALGGTQITLQIGRFIRMENCIITNVDAQFDAIIGESGVPHKAKVTVEVCSFYTCFTTEDIDDLFVGGT